MKNTFYTASIFFQIMTMTLLDRRLFTKIVVKLYVRNQFTLLINTTQYLGHGLNNTYARINRGQFSLQCKMSYFISKFEAVCNADASSTMIYHAKKASIVCTYPKY